MAQNITLMGASYPDVPSIELPKTGGGIASFVDISDTDAIASDVRDGKKIYLADGTPITGTADLYNWMGAGAEFVTEIYPAQEFALGDTSFNGWSPSTTAKVIKSTVNAGTFVADMNNYEYLIKWQCDTDVTYAEETVTKARFERAGAVLCQLILRRPNSLANIAAENYAGNACVTYRNSALMEYYNASSSHTYTWALSYGIYPSATAAAFSSTTSLTPTVTVKTPAWNARCSTTYFSTTVAKAVDQTASKFRMKCDVYRMKIGSPERSILDELVDLFNNPISTD